MTRANLETPLPLIDIVNECLRTHGVEEPACTAGAVYNTSEHHLGPYKLCDDDCENGSELPRLRLRARRLRLPWRTPHASRAATNPPRSSAPCRNIQRRRPRSRRIAPSSPPSGTSSRRILRAAACPTTRRWMSTAPISTYFRSCRFEAMRTFRKCITEFVLDPVNQPADFQTHLWRYPVRLDIAIEYLGLSPEEYDDALQRRDAGTVRRAGHRPAAAHRRGPSRGRASLARGVPAGGDVDGAVSSGCPISSNAPASPIASSSNSGAAASFPFDNGHDHHGFPECEPCCLDDLWLRFPEGNPDDWIGKIAVFIRLWQKLRHHLRRRLHASRARGYLQGAEFLRPRLHSPARRIPDAARPVPTEAHRQRRSRPWARPAPTEPSCCRSGSDQPQNIGTGRSSHLLDGIAKHAECHHECERRGPEFIKLLADNLDPLSRLAGFDPATPPTPGISRPPTRCASPKSWRRSTPPTSPSARCCSSSPPDTHLDGDDPFPLQDPNEAERLAARSARRRPPPLAVGTAPQAAARPLRTRSRSATGPGSAIESALIARVRLRRHRGRHVWASISSPTSWSSPASRSAGSAPLRRASRCRPRCQCGTRRPMARSTTIAALRSSGQSCRSPTTHVLEQVHPRRATEPRRSTGRPGCLFPAAADCSAISRCCSTISAKPSTG